MTNYKWQVTGHQKISQFLQKSLDNDRLNHAYLFSGQEHLGKGLLAREFMATILCADYHRQKQAKPEFLPCQTCVFCDQLARGIHPDVFILAKEEDKKNISVEQVREMHKFLNLTSFLNSYKIALIDKAEDLSESAQNALLKVLEEPRSKTILILICRDYNLLLPTIVSRCQLLKFLPLAKDEIFDFLQKQGATREQAGLYSALAHGQIGLAENFLKNPELFKNYLEKTGQFIDLFSLNLADRFKAVESLLADRNSQLEKAESLNQEIEAWQIILRDIIFCQNNLQHLTANYYFQEKLAKLGEKYSTGKLLLLTENLRKIRQLLTYNINPRLAVENFFLNF